LKDPSPFISAFTKALSEEMAAMRSNLGTHELPLGPPKELPNTRSGRSYRFTITQDWGRIQVGMECTLRDEEREFQVEILSITENALTLQCEDEFELDAPRYTLVIYPWFLYERLLEKLHKVGSSTDFFTDSALGLFGQSTNSPQIQDILTLDHPVLNSSQRNAVQTCWQNDISFIWGPPGTGKTKTLAAILTEFVRNDLRTLVVSTTNIAIDQALTTLLETTALSPAACEQVVRVGRGDSTPLGYDLESRVAKHSEHSILRVKSLREKVNIRTVHQRAIEKNIASLSTRSNERQMNLFSEMPVPSSPLSRESIAAIGPLLAVRWRILPPEEIILSLERRLDRLTKSIALFEEKVHSLVQEIALGQRQILTDARLVFCTMSTAYLHRSMNDQRFDTVVVEEAGMALLPTLFYCASLAKKRVIAVGDPQQLPSIIHSKSPFVLRALGRNIFEVAGATESNLSHVALLSTQYRMHPHIGQLVSTLYYNNLLEHEPDRLALHTLKQSEPFSNSALVLFDTSGTTKCEKAGKYSRINLESGQIALSLAMQAVENKIKTVGIITPYSEQAKYIQQLVQASSLDAKQVQSSTVHRFQGQERDLIIFDTTDSGPLKPGVLLNTSSAAKQLINVSLSRARGKLIVIADRAYFLERAPKGEITRLVEAMYSDSNSLYHAIKG